MSHRISINTCLVFCGVLLATQPTFAQSGLAKLLPFKKIDADPNKSYELTKDRGPWMILATSFAGNGAEKQAHDLVLELRQRFKLPAYVHEQHFDFSQPVQGLGVNSYGEPKKMKHLSSHKFDEIAVLVGNYPTVDHPDLEKTLKLLKFAHPQCLDIHKNKNLTQRYAGIRYAQRFLGGSTDDEGYGPMAAAFATRNPLSPQEVGVQGVEPFVVEMNKEVEFSLLDNTAAWTVKVATFSGHSTMKANEIEKLRNSNVTSKLEDAAMKAHQLTMALRKQGIEAYEFHDRTESIVTIGSFESEGSPWEGKIAINPAMYEVIKRYKAEQQQIPGQATFGLQPKRLAGISFDVQPEPIKVPRVSVGAKYARSRMD